jgi:hypothetical protein
MSRALPVLPALALAAALSLGAHAALRLWTPRSGLEVMPVFVPASLAVEQDLRAQRGQPAGRGGLEAAELAAGLLQRPVPPAQAAALSAPLARLAEGRARLLEARGRRHHLNVALMRAGVELGRALDADQWDWIQGSRDQVKASREAALFDALERKLAAPR